MLLKSCKGETYPVRWDDLEKPIMYQSGLPSREDLHLIPSKSVIVIDDLYEEVCKSSDISYLFRVLSGKRQLHVIIMTQRYCAEGSSGLTLRNSSNIHVLMNNVDVRANNYVCNIMGLKKEHEIAVKSLSESLYPAIVIDRSNEARVSGLQLYTDIFNRYRKVVFNRMISYVVNAEDFDTYFKKIGPNLAVQHETPKAELSVTAKSHSSDTETENDSESANRKSNQSQQSKQVRRDLNRQIKRQVRIALYRRKKRAELQRKTW